MKRFDNFSIESIPREEKHLVDKLSISVSTLQVFKEISLYRVEVNCRPLIPNNLEQWHVFYNENYILRFLQNEGELSETQIKLLEEEMNIEIIDFLDEPLPKGVIPLDVIFFIEMTCIRGSRQEKLMMRSFNSILAPSNPQIWSNLEKEQLLMIGRS